MADESKKASIEEVNLLKQRIAELEKLYNELRQQQHHIRRFETVVRDSNDSIIIQDLDGRITAWNLGAERMYGYKEKEALGMSIERLTPAHKVAEHREFTRRLITGEEVSSFETERITKDGRIIDVWLTVTKILERPLDSIISTGRDVTNPISIALIERNISERKKAHDELRRSEERFRAIFDNANDGLLLADAANKKFYLGNNTICEMLGYSQEEIKTLSVADIHPQEKLLYVIGQFERLARREITLAEDIPVKRKDGSVFYADINCSVMMLDEKPSIFGVFRDITERKMAQEEIRKSEIKFRTLVEHIPKKVFIKDKNSAFLFANKLLCNDLKIRPEEIIGKTDYDFFPKGLADKYIADDKRIIESGKTEDFEEKYIEYGEERWVHTIKTAYRDDKGKIIGVLGIFRDITEHKKAEEEERRHAQELQVAYSKLNEVQALVVQASKLSSIGQMAGGLAHEINNPLAGVINNVQLIRMEAESKEGFNLEEFRELLGVVEESALRCKRITQSLLNFSHASTGISLPLSLNEVVENVTILIAHELKLQNIIIQKDLQPDLPFILGDSQLFQQVIFNFISNAKWAIQKKSAKNGGTITIKTHYAAEKKEACISVSDTGIGIPKDNLEKIFESFFSTKEVGEGTGLGLSLAADIIRKHQGRIEVESQLGEGATFRIAFPVIS